nr:MAG: hypothetical protein [Cressdnaviricota sp.]
MQTKTKILKHLKKNKKKMYKKNIPPSNHGSGPQLSQIDVLIQEQKKLNENLIKLVHEIAEIHGRLEDIEEALGDEEEYDDEYETNDGMDDSEFQPAPKPLKKQKAKDISKWIDKKDF